MFKEFLDAIGRSDIKFKDWLVACFGIILVRTYLETFSARASTSIVSSDVQTIIHYTLFYVQVYVILILILHFFARKSVAEASNIVLIGSLIILTPPISDLIFSGGVGYQMSYIFVPYNELFLRYVSFFGEYTVPGITVGVRFEILCVTTAVLVYTYQCTQKIVRSLLSGLATYSGIFFCVAFPSFFGIGGGMRWLQEIQATLLGGHFFHPEMTFTSIQRVHEMYFNVVISHAMFAVILTVSAILAWRFDASKVRAILKNSRPERIVHYMLAIALGILLAMHEDLVRTSHVSWLDITTLAYLFVAFISAWMFAVGVNDIVDVKSDSISNSSRPLVTGTLTLEDMRNANSAFFLTMLISGYLAGHYALFMVLSFTAIYYVYSVPPIHLKRFAIVNSFFIALATLSAVYAGFYTVSTTPTLDAFPKEWALLIVAWYTLVANIKDIKDTAGDRAVGVYTLTVLLGPKYGRVVIGSMVVCALICVPLITGVSQFWYPALLFAPVAYSLVQREPFSEKYLFYLYFAYVVTLVFMATYL